MRGDERQQVVFLSTFPPRRCGLATFTNDLVDALDRTGLFAPSAVFALSNAPGEYIYGPQVVLEITQDRRADYRQAASYVNEGAGDLVCLQHEFGIFGGTDGCYVLDFVEALRKPLVTTLHTVLSQPDAGKRQIIQALAARSQVVVVMADRARRMLTEVYGIDPAKVVFVPHGAPAVPALPRQSIRRQLGLEGRLVISTMGLINPGKGIEYVIESLPEIVADHPEVIYLVLGQTHPGVLRYMGEAYRDKLLQTVKRLSLQDHVRFVASYLSQRQLVNYLAATDIYVTPYLGREQITSGTLAYALAMGKAIVSTPYFYAEELLGNGAGVLVGFRDSRSIGEAIRTLIARPDLRTVIEARAGVIGRDMTWPKVGQQYARLFLETLVPRPAVMRAAGSRPARALARMAGYRFGNGSSGGAGKGGL